MIFSVFTVHKIQFILNLHSVPFSQHSIEVRVQSLGVDLEGLRSNSCPSQIDPQPLPLGTSHRSERTREVPSGRIFTILLRPIHYFQIYTWYLAGRCLVWESQCLPINPCPGLLPCVITGLLGKSNISIIKLLTRALYCIEIHI